MFFLNLLFLWTHRDIYLCTCLSLFYCMPYTTQLLLIVVTYWEEVLFGISSHPFFPLICYVHTVIIVNFRLRLMMKGWKKTRTLHLKKRKKTRRAETKQRRYFTSVPSAPFLLFDWLNDWLDLSNDDNQEKLSFYCYLELTCPVSSSAQHWSPIFSFQTKDKKPKRHNPFMPRGKVNT